MKIVNRKPSKIRLFFGLIVAAALILPTMSMAAYLVDPIAHWKLEEAAPNYLDQGGNGYHLECSGPCPVLSDSDSVVGNAQQFGQDPNDGRYRALRVLLSIDQQTPLYNWAYDQDFAIELWFKRDSGTAFNDGAEVFIGRGDNGSDLQWWLGMWGGSKIGRIAAHFRATNDDGDREFIESTKSYNDGVWHHVALVRDASASLFTLYVDGEVQGTRLVTYSDTGSFSSDDELHIGELNTPDYFEFQGLMDEIALYSQTLSAVDVAGHYAAGLIGKGYDESFDAVIQSTTPDLAYVGYAFTHNVLGAGNPTPTFALTEGPEGMAIDTVSGQLAWTPNSEQVGDNTVTVTADNGGAAPASDTFAVEATDLCDSQTTNYWKLEDVSVLADFTLNGKDGSCTSCPSGITGQAGNALDFDSSAGNFVQIDPDGTGNDSIDIPLGQSFSVAAWVNRADGIDSTEVAVGRDAAGGMQLWLGITAGDSAAFSLQDDSGSGRLQVTGSTDIADGGWHLVVGIYDAGEGELRLYVDGDEDATPVVATTFSAGFTSATEPLVIGALNTSAGFAFNGGIDEVALFKFALGTDLMAQMMTNSKGYCQAAPVITTTAGTSVDEGATFLYDADATDPDDTVFAWSLANAPADMSVDPGTGAVSWTPASGVTTSGAVTLRVDDGFGGRDSETFTVAVNSLPPSNQPPVITGQVVDPISMVEDTPREITLADLVASDPDGDTIQMASVADGDNYSVSGFTVTPDSGYTGDLTVPVTVTDGTASSSAFDLNVVVTGAGDPLQILSTAGTSVDEGDTYSYTPSVSNPQSFTLTWTLSNAPSGMTVDATSGVVTWTPGDGVTTSGAVTLTVSGGGESADEIFTITVNTDNGGGGGGGGGGGCFIDTTSSHTSGGALGMLLAGVLGIAALVRQNI